jgi:hypothetical protein
MPPIARVIKATETKARVKVGLLLAKGVSLSHRPKVPKDRARENNASIPMALGTGLGGLRL